jgi:ribA/ribD-fused uncharacterized protein
MGYGEGYNFKLHDWMTTLSRDEVVRYQTMFPTPKTWAGYYENLIPAYIENCAYGVDFWNKNGEPKYTTESLVIRENDGEHTEFIYFWKPGELLYDCFSQWQPSTFTEEVVTYYCAEQYMMVKKAQIFQDEKNEKMILEASDPKQMKSLGRKVKNFDEKTWDELKYSVVLNGNYHKFAQNQKMREILLATGDKILVEASPLDKIWGVGYSDKNPKAADPEHWRGTNLLGFALMEVRDEIKTVYQNYDKIDWEQLEYCK